VASVKKILIAAGLAANAALAMQNIGLADCGGLFLLHQSDKQFSIKSCNIRDSLKVSNFELYGAFHHVTVQGRYTDGWSVKSLSQINVASAGFVSRYKYITLGVQVNTLPMITSNISVHRKDSLFRANVSVSRGSIHLTELSWIPDKQTEVVGTIPIDWVSHVLYRHLSAESKFGNNYVNLSLNKIQTTPRNSEKEHYIRDSVNVLALNAKYRHDFGMSRLDASYLFVNADATLYGIFHSENSRKRFLYAPLEATFHWGNVKWNTDNLQTHLEYIYLSGSLKSNPNRFYESLAPNRILPPSTIKGLSFAFLQKVFRIDADLDAYGFLGGASYCWILGKQNKFIPNVGIDFFKANGEIDIDKRTETTKVMGASYAYNKNTQQKLSSLGSVLSLGIEYHKKGNVDWSVDYGISQIIPFYIDYKKSNASKKISGNNKTSDNNISSQLFRNGFATRLGMSVNF
jgi:hypothetical protein